MTRNKSALFSYIAPVTTSSSWCESYLARAHEADEPFLKSEPNSELNIHDNNELCFI
jgi:hypothetical protein